MPEPNKPLIMVATGTGIAPFRAFWRRAFFEQVCTFSELLPTTSCYLTAFCAAWQVPNYKFSGLFWVFMGVANSDSKLYDDELQAIAASTVTAQNSVL